MEDGEEAAEAPGTSMRLCEAVAGGRSLLWGGREGAVQSGDQAPAKSRRRRRRGRGGEERGWGRGGAMGSRPAGCSRLTAVTWSRGLPACGAALGMAVSAAAGLRFPPLR